MLVLVVSARVGVVSVYVYVLYFYIGRQYFFSRARCWDTMMMTRYGISYYGTVLDDGTGDVGHEKEKEDEKEWI